MENKEIVAEATNEVKTVTAESTKPTILERVKEVPSKIGQGAKKHWKGISAGAAAVLAVGTAAIIAGKAAAEGAIETPFDIDGPIDTVKDTVSDIVDEA